MKLSTSFSPLRSVLLSEGRLLGFLIKIWVKMSKKKGPQKCMRQKLEELGGGALGSSCKLQEPWMGKEKGRM